MLLYNRSIKLLILALVGVFMLAGCTLRPVYDGASTTQFAIQYEKPDTKIEQVIFQELAFKLGRSSAPKYRLSLATSTSDRNMHTVGSQFPRSEQQATVKTSYVLTVIATDEKLLSGSRFSSAIYQKGNQIVANKAAQGDAYQRAAKDLARQIELLIIVAINEDQP